MPIQIRFIENPVLHPQRDDYRAYDGTVDFDKLAVGDMCFYHFRGVPCVDRPQLEFLHLTTHYFAHNVLRPPLILALPDHASPRGKLYFMVDGQCFSNKCDVCGKSAYKNGCAPAACRPRGYYDGWTVNGNIMNITVSPSVNYDDDEHGVKHYHGHIQGGIIGDG